MEYRIPNSCSSSIDLVPPRLRSSGDWLKPSIEGSPSIPRSFLLFFFIFFFVFLFNETTGRLAPAFLLCRPSVCSKLRVVLTRVWQIPALLLSFSRIYKSAHRSSFRLSISSFLLFFSYKLSISFNLVLFFNFLQINPIKPF